VRTLVRTNLYVLLIKGSTRRRVKKEKWANYLAAEVIEKVRTEQVRIQIRTHPGCLRTESFCKVALPMVRNNWSTLEVFSCSLAHMPLSVIRDPELQKALSVDDKMLEIMRSVFNPIKLSW